MHKPRKLEALFAMFRLVYPNQGMQDIVSIYDGFPTSYTERIPVAKKKEKKGEDSSRTEQNI